MKINWKVRLKNKSFWLALIPALLLLIQQVCAMFGLTLDLVPIQEQLLGIVGTVFTLLALFGIVNDPTTAERIIPQTHTTPARTLSPGGGGFCVENF